MLKLIKIILSILAGVLVVYGLIKQNDNWMPVIQIILGLLFLMNARIAFQKGKKTDGFFSTGLFVYFIVVFALKLIWNI